MTITGIAASQYGMQRRKLLQECIDAKRDFNALTKLQSAAIGRMLKAQEALKKMREHDEWERSVRGKPCPVDPSPGSRFRFRLVHPED